MNVSALLWLSIASIGFGVALATWVILQQFVQRFIETRASRALHTNHVIVTTHLNVSDWIPYGAVGIGFPLAFKLTWDGAWILAACLVFATMILIGPIRVWMKTRAIPDATPEIDFALICIEHGAKNKPVLQTLDEASAAFEHPKIRAVVQNSLQQFYNGEPERHVLRNLVSEQTNSVWGLLIWTLCAQRQMNDSANLRKQVTELMRERFALEQRARPAFAWLRRKLAIAFFLCAIASAFLTISPASSLDTSSLKGQAIGSVALMILVGASHLWAVELQSLRTMIE
jgi:hypothetical protein